MHYLAYVSSATNKLSEKELLSLLEKAKVNNERSGITGLLIYIDGNIIQILEGEKDNVYDIYSKISSDHRHTGILKLLEGSLSERNFKEWSMQFKSLSYAETSLITGYKNLSKENFLSYSNQVVHPALKLIASFCKTNIY